MSRRKQQRPSQLSEDDKESKRNKGDKHSDAISTAGSVKKENPPNVVRRPRGRPRKYNLTPPSLTDGACSVSIASSKATTTTTTTSSEETDNAESVDGSPDVKDEGKGPLTRKRSKMTCFDTPPPEAAAQTNLKMKGGKKAVDLSNKICNVCGKVNKSPSNLERHMRVHTGEKPFACIRCGKAFKCKRSQQTHQYLCHGITDGISQSRLEMLQATRRRMDVDSEGNADVEMDGFKCLSGMKSPHTEAQMCNSMSLPVCSSSKADGEAKCLDGSNVTCYSSEQEASKPMNLTTTDKSQRIEPCFTGVAKAESSNNELPSHHPTSNADARGTAENVAHKSEGTHVLCEHCGQGFNSAQNLALHQQSFHNAKILTAASSENPNPAPKRRRGRPPSTVHLERPTMVPVPKVTERSIDCSLDNMNLLSGVASSISRNESEGINLDHGLSFAPFKDSNMNHALGMQHQHFATDRRESLGEPNLFVCSQNLESSSQFGDPNKTHCAATDANGNIAQGHLLNPGTQLLTMVGLVEQQNSFVWQSIKVQSEKPLVTRLEGMHCATEQSYVLYKCCLCGNAFPGLAMLSSHLTAHIRNNKEHCCEKCGACFKWRSQLQVHEQVHQVIDNKLAMASPMVPQNFLVMNPAMNLRMPPNCSPPPGAMHSPHSAIQTNPSAVTTSNCTQNLSSLAHIHSPNQCISPHSPSAISQSNCETMVGRKGRRGAVKHKLPFNCKYCPKSFDRVFSLQRHERIHTGVKPCFCKVCGRGFSERRNLRHHMIRFHSDNNERELLRRSRRQARQRGNSTSQRLVSFLKKTAVRILNSMDQSRLDPPMSPQDGEMMQPVDGTIPETAMTNEMVPHSAEQDRNDAGHNPSSQIKLEHEEEKVTVVFPTDAPDKCSNTPEPSDPAPSSNAEEQVEVLKDPKRSLMGNRRKGRPFKYTPCQGVMPREDSAIVHSEKSKSEYSSQSPVSNQPNPTTDGLAIGGEPLPSSEINENQAHTNEEAQQASEAENPKDPSSKTRIPGHGAFFSSYNPRLGVVEKPIARAEACRPHLSSDGKHIYPCSYCFKTFCSTSDLNRHMDFHEDIRPFKCRYCEYYSRTISQIKVHMMRHQGIKQFLCQMCNYNGVTQSDLNRHCKTRNHVLRAKNVCSYCGLGFYTRTLLEEHVRMFHHSGDLQQASFYNGQQAEPRMNCEESITEAPVLAQPVQQSFTDTPDKSGPFTNAGSANSDIPLQAKFSVEDNNNDYAFGSKNDAVSNAVLDKQSKAVEDDDNEALNLSSAKT